MERGRGSFHPVRWRGGFRAVEGGCFISRGRRPFRGFQIRNIGNHGSLRGGGQFLQANRHLSNEDLRNRIQDRKEDWAKDSGRKFNEIRSSHDSSDAESVSSEFDATSARYSRHHVDSGKGKQNSNSPLLDQTEKVKCRKRTPVKRRVYADSQLLREDMTGLSEDMKRQTLNDLGELPLVERIGRQGHIQKGLPRFHGPRGNHPFEFFQKKTFYPKGRGYTSHTFGRFDDRIASRQGDSRERDRERTLHKEPKVKKQQASWIPMVDEEETDKEKPVSLQSESGPTEKKKGLATEKDLITQTQSKRVQQRKTASSKVKPILEQNSTQERKQKQHEKTVSVQEDAYSELTPSEKDSSDISEVEEGNKNNSSKGHDERNTVMQEKRDFRKDLPESGSGLPCCRGEINFDISAPRIEHVSKRNSVDYGRRSGSLERDEHSWIGLEGKWEKSPSDESDDCMKVEEMNNLKRDDDETQLRSESSSFIYARPARKFTLGNRGDISKSLLESVRSSSKEGDDLYRSDDESPKDDIYRKELEEALQAERDKKDMEPVEPPENYRCRKDHVSRREHSIPKGIHSSASKQDPVAYIPSTSERGKVPFKIKCYGMLNNQERCTANTRMIGNCRSDSKDRTSEERRESSRSTCSREKSEVGERQRSRDKFYLQEMHPISGNKRVCGGTDMRKRHSLSENGENLDWSDCWQRYSMKDSKRYNKNILDSAEQNMIDRRGNISDWSHSSDQEGQLSSTVRYMAKTRYHESSQTIEKHIFNSRENANDSYQLREKDSIRKQECVLDRSGYSSDSEDCDVINNSKTHSWKLVPKLVKSDSSESSSVSDSDHDKLKYNIKRRIKCPDNLHPTDRHTSGRQQRRDSSHTSESHSEDERQNVSGRSESLESYSRKKHVRHRKPRRRHSRERKEPNQYSMYSSERSESVVSYSRSERKYHKRSKYDRRYAAVGSMSNSDTSDSSESYLFSSGGYRDYARQKPDGGYSRSDSWESYSTRSGSSDHSDSSDRYTWNRRDRSSSRERYEVDKRDRKSDGSRFSDVHHSSSRDGSHSSPFKSPTSERRFKYKDSDDNRERSNDYDSPVKMLPYAKRYPLPRPRVGYGRHIFPSFRQSPRSRSRSKSVSVARSKVNFYEKFKNKSKCWVKAQADLIKEVEKKLMQEGISSPPAKMASEEKENTVDLVKAAESLQITVEHATKESISVAQDAVILQEHITMSKSSNSDQSPKKKSHRHLTRKEHKLSAGATSTAFDVTEGQKEIEMVYAFKDPGNQISKVTRKEKQETKVTDIHEGNTEAGEWRSRQVFMKETTPTKPIDKVTSALHSAYGIPDVATIHENSSVDKVSDVKGSLEPVGQPETSKTVGDDVQNTIKFQTLWKKKISSKPGIKVILAGKTNSSTSPPKKSFWNDRQKQRLNKGFRFSPVRKTIPVTELSKTLPKSVSKTLSGPLETTDEEVTELISKERIPRKKLVKFQALKSTDELSPTSQSPNVLSKNATTKVEAPLNPSKEKIIDIFEDDPNTEVSKSELKQSMKVTGSKRKIQDGVKTASRKEPDLNIPLPISRSTMLDKSSSTSNTSTGSTDPTSSQDIETLTNRSMKLSSDVHVSDEKKMVSDKSDRKTSVFIRDKTEASHSDHEEVDMDLEDEEPNISLEEDTSWMGRELDSSSTSFSDQMSYFVPGSTSTAFTSPTQLSAWGPGFGTYPPFLHQYIPMGCPPPGYGGNWYISPNIQYGSQQYWAQQPVDGTHAEQVVLPDGQPSQTISEHISLAQGSALAQDSSLKDSLDTSSLQSQQASCSPVLSPVQPTKDQIALLGKAPPLPPEDPVSSSEVPPLPEDPFPLPHLTPVQPPDKCDPLLVPIPVQSADNPSDCLHLKTPQLKTVPVPVAAPADRQTGPISSVSSIEVLPLLVPSPGKSDPLLVSDSVQPTEDPAVSLYRPISQPETVAAPVPAPIDEYTSLVSLAPSADVVPLLVPPPKDHVCLPVPPPKETMPCLVSPAGRAVTLPILSPGKSVLSLMPAPASESKEIPAHVSPLTSAPVLSPQKSLSVTSPLIAHVPTPVPAPVQQSNTSIHAPPKLSPNITEKGTTSLFRQDVVSSLIPPLQHTPVLVHQNVSMKHVSVPLPVPPPQEWSSEKISASDELCLTENPALTTVPNPVTSPQQFPTQQSNFTLNQSKDSKSEVTSSQVIQVPDLPCIYSQESELPPLPLLQKSSTKRNTEITDHTKQIPLVVSIFQQPKTATPNQSTHQPSVLSSFPTSTVYNKSHQRSVVDDQMESAKHQHLSPKKAQSSEMLVRGQSKDIACSSSDDSSNTIDSSSVNVLQSSSLQSRDPRLQRRTLETKNDDRNPHPVAACEKATQKRPQTHSAKPKRKTNHLDAQSKCLKQLKSILKSSLAKSSVNSLVPKKLSKPKIHEPGSVTLNTISSQHISHFDSTVPNSQETCQKTLNKPQPNPDADYTDVPMDIDETEDSNPELVSSQPVLPETEVLTVYPPQTHGAPASVPTSLPYDTASNTANSSNPPNKPSRDPRLQVQSKKYEEETRIALKTLFKVLQRSQSARITTSTSERLKPVAQTDMALQRQGRSSQGTPTGPGSTTQTFEIVKTPDSKKPANVAVVNPEYTENEASTSRLKPQGLFPVSECRVSNNAFVGDSGGGAGREGWEGCQGKDAVVKEAVLTTSSIPVTSSELVVPSLPVTEPVPVTPSLLVSPVPDTVTPEVNSNGASNDINPFDNCNLFDVTLGDGETAPTVGATCEKKVLGAPVIKNGQDWDNAQSSDDAGHWLAEPPVPKETQFSLSMKPVDRNVSDQGIFNKLVTLPDSSPSDVERSPVYPSTSFNLQDMKRGSGVSVQPLSSGSLSTEKVRGMSHKDVSEWVKKSSAQCLIDPETTSLGRCHPQGKKRHGEMEKRRHHSGSSGSSRLNSNSSVKTLGSDRAKIELGGKTSGKSPKGNIKRFLSHEGSPRGKEEFSRSKSVDNSMWAPEISNPLGSYRIPKLSSAATDSLFKESGEEREKEEKNRKGASKSVDESSDNTGSDSDDLFNETPAFLKEFEETRKTILAAGMMPGTPDNTLNESMHSDDSLVLDEPTVSYKPTSKSTDGKSTISLDALLAEKVENEVTDRELNTIQKELKEGIKLGGFVRLAEAEGDDDSDDELLPEHHQKLQYFQVSENTIQDQHPGEVVLHPGKFPCLYSEVLSPVRCGFRPSDSFLEKHLATIHPDALTDLLTTDMLSICFHKITAQEEILRWIFFIMSVHRDSCVIQGCKKLVFDIIHTQLSLDETSSTWAPSILDILKVLVNFGGETSDLLQAQTLFSQEDIRAAIIPENDDNLTSAGDNNNIPTRSYAENVREFLQTVAFALQGRPQYTAAELNVLLVMMAKTSLEKEFSDNVLLYEFSVLTSSILPCYKEEDWTSVMPSLCYQLSEVTSHHHNFVYLAQLFPHGKRGSSIQRRLAYLLLMKMLQPDTRVPREQLVGYKLHQLNTFFPALRELAADDLYALSSAVALLDIAVGNEQLRGSEKNDLLHLMELLRTLTSDVRDNVRRLDHTRVKDLMVRISSKWTVTLQTATSKQRNLFAWTKQKSPQKMQVQRLETGASDVETDEEEEEEEDEEEECPDEADAAPENLPVLMDIDIGGGGDNNIGASVNNVVKPENDIDVEVGETSCPDEDVRTANVNNNADVEDKDVAGASGSSAVIKSEVRVVLEDICMSREINEDELSSDESLPELDITL